MKEQPYQTLCSWSWSLLAGLLFLLSGLASSKEILPKSYCEKYPDSKGCPKPATPPPSPDLELEEIQRQVASGDCESALKNLSSYIKQYGSANAELYWLKGYCYKDENPEAACGAYQKFLKLAPGDTRSEQAKKYIAAQDLEKYPVCEWSPPASAPTTETLSYLSYEQLNETLRRLSFTSCNVSNKSVLSVALTIDGLGHVSSAYAGESKAKKCVAALIKEARFPALPKPYSAYTYSVQLDFSKPAKPKK